MLKIKGCKIGQFYSPFAFVNEHLVKKIRNNFWIFRNCYFIIMYTNKLLKRRNNQQNEVIIRSFIIADKVVLVGKDMAFKAN